MSDYERYGDYDRGEDEEPEGPPRSRFSRVLSRTLKILLAVILIAACLMLAFRMIFSGYYPREMKRLYHTDALVAYAATLEGQPTVETQDIRVPFESEILTVDKIEDMTAGKSQNGYFYADNLLLVREAGSLQCSLRLNQQAPKDIAAAYAVPDFTMSETAFVFTLRDNLGRTYEPVKILTDSALFYHYMKLCFDGLDFTDVSWLRLEIAVAGADMTEEGHPTLAVCVYENHEEYADFTSYRLRGDEKF